MMRALRTDPHLLQRQADLAPHVFPFVIRRDVHIACLIVGPFCGFAGFVAVEQVKLHFRSKGEGNSHLLRLCHSLAQELTDVGVKRRSVWPGDRAKHAHDPPVIRTPRQHTQRGGVRVQEQVRMHLIAKTRNG